MSPLAVLKTLWSHKIITLPVVILTLLASVYVFQFAPRSYDSTMTYALINPSIPSQDQILQDPKLGKLNSNNPYLRSSDPSLIVQVVITRLNDPVMGQKLVAEGLSPKYTVTRSVSGQSSFLIDIVGTAATPAGSVATARALGKELETNLYELQKVNGASDQYTYTSLVVVSPDQAVEQFSSRLRSLVVVFLGGAVLMFGAVSAARAFERGRDKKRELAAKPLSAVGPGGDPARHPGSSADQTGPIDISSAMRTNGHKLKNSGEEQLARVGSRRGSRELAD
ncbi:chain-length determining protein [Arthrobacter livingstonensis]|uniref:Chain-length determining protein n=1 Tax=Arthrobacter livingstonensis TaxID=670078 RepID=A0A2V5LA53_9MICC|nr:chain-length determining protein [Arthrobacter livingstonensis]PYI68359.1 chain-length determining protein [Arthrobacter livingstonensis]